MNTTTRNFTAMPRTVKKTGWTPLGIAAMVIGFMIKWYLGLAVLGYMMWGGRVDDLINDISSMIKGVMSPAPASSGNAAFDAYKAQVLKDLEEEQRQFNDYVEQLRKARDRDEFERFMKSRKNKKK